MKSLILFSLGLVVAFSVFNVQATISTPTSSQQTSTETPNPPRDEW